VKVGDFGGFCRGDRYRMSTTGRVNTLGLIHLNAHFCCRADIETSSPHAISVFLEGFKLDTNTDFRTNYRRKGI
jgi:hypothetical protein